MHTGHGRAATVKTAASTISVLVATTPRPVGRRRPVKGIVQTADDLRPDGHPQRYQRPQTTGRDVVGGEQLGQRLVTYNPSTNSNNTVRPAHSRPTCTAVRVDGSSRQRSTAHMYAARKTSRVTVES
jgi:hypothetical protein